MIFGQFLAWIKRKDLTTVGSTNVGATNVKREFGYLAALIVSLLDAIKGLVAVVICWAIYKVSVDKIWHNPNLYCLVYISGVFAIIGHCYPIQYFIGLVSNHFDYDKMRKYKGGKGVSTSGGVLFSVSPYLGLIAFVVWLIIVLTTRYVSLGSLFCMTIATMFVFIPQVGSFYLFDNSALYGPLPTTSNWWSSCPWLMCGTFVFLMVNNVILTLRHRPNIIRLMSHQETKLF